MFQQRLLGGTTAFPELAGLEWELCPLQHRVCSLTRDFCCLACGRKTSGVFLCLQHADFPCHCLEIPSETGGMGSCC